MCFPLTASDDCAEAGRDGASAEPPFAEQPERTNAMANDTE